MTVNIDTTKAGISDFSGISEKLKQIKCMELPAFVTHRPDISRIKEDCSRLQGYKNIILIGNGGSVNSSYALYYSLGRTGDREFSFLTTMEPDHISFLKSRYKKEDTAVLIISKSGTNIGPLESMFSFLADGYNIVSMTEDPNGALMKIAKRKAFPLILHPNIGGRYSGRSSCAMVPAELMGIDISGFNKGCIDMYDLCAPSVDISNNPALRLASTLYLLEKQGKVDVFMPCYSMQLSGFLKLIVQLMHESFGKNSIGQTYFGGDSPETQHHTNQRFFGGRKNITGLFIRSESQDDNKRCVEVPCDLLDIRLREGSLGDISGVPYEKALEYEFKGTWEHALEKNIPVSLVSVDSVNACTMGEFMAFWQYVAVYASLLRDVDPFDQPQVEASKEISFKMRKAYNTGSRED
ncbi:hypothetical protein JXB31_03970 [Candidatus Woesearchaeota archaeon]|nr:hypothetical protein [Candidatus Woesearchaeota archaeon]